MVEKKLKSKKVDLLSRIYLLFHIAPLFTWVTIASLKLLLEVLFHILKYSVDNATTIQWLNAALRLSSLPLIALGLMSVSLICFEILVDVIPSKSKLLFAFRTRVHRMLALASNKSAPTTPRLLSKLFSSALFYIVPLILIGLFVMFALLFNAKQCPAEFQSFQKSSLACEALTQALVANALVLLQIIVATKHALSIAAKNNKISPFDQLFACYDADYSGVVSEDEIANIMGVSQKEAKDLVKQFDADGDKEINMDEFRAMAASAKASGRLVLPKQSSGDSGFTRVIKSPDLFTHFTASLVRVFVLTTLATLPLFAAIGGLQHGSFWVIGNYLSVSTFNVGLLSLVWLGVLLCDQLVEVCLLPLSQRVPYLLTWLVVPALMAVPDYRQPVWLVILLLSLLNIHGLFIRQTQARQGAKSGSNALKYVSLALLAVFATLGALFVVSALQVMSGTRNDIPDAFEVRNVTGSSLELHTVIGGVSIAHARIAAQSSRVDGNRKFAPCAATSLGVSLQEATLLSQMAYLKCGGKQLESMRVMFFPDFDLVSDCKRSAAIGGATFLHFKNRNDARNVVAIRGTHVFDILDWIQDVELWIEAVMYTCLETVFLGLRAWSLDSRSQTIGLVNFNIQGLLGDDHTRYYDSTVDYVSKLDADKTLVVGHSLGGGLAKIVGTKCGVPSIALSGPGIVEGVDKFGIDLQDLNLLVTNIVPSHDAVPMLGTLGGSVHNLICEARRPDLCHQPLLTTCYLQQICDGKAGGRVSDCKFNY